jgi:GAF domain-containing protein
VSSLLPDTTKEVVGSLLALLTAGGWLWNRRTGGGGLTTVYHGVISFLAAPVERSLAQREAKALRRDNDRLSADNEAKDREIARLRALCLPDSNTGSSNNEDGNDPTSP